MKNHNEVEVILFAKQYFKGPAHKELVKWLATTVQPVIDRQERRAKKLFTGKMKYTPLIYLS